ncbi:MAG: HAMP domain-containing sensor histidine kinase [Microbacterium sp.]|uniref:sensor histidine kinase n=1 Tax=Microbacterium sp. TaxID=51671 RepID=UPI002720065E|nr:HAMP domain-containing sensor histidine kinase [Microbacterium sp.]MDO8382786.1 HAMP domain-containing sensor histidine kinase [Microbacterium sp.]
MHRRSGPSARLKLTLSYAGFVMIAGALLLGAVWVFLLRYVPDGSIPSPGPFFPSRSDLLRAFVPAAAWVVFFLLVFGLVGGWFLAGRMLAPLARVTDVARQTKEGSLSARVHLPGREDEFRELADAFDAMLDRVETQLAEQQRFAANASHELRTPLAITQTLLDVAQNDPTSDTPQVLDRLRSVNARAIQITEALLVLSRADQRSFAVEPVDLSLLVEEAAENLHALAEGHGVTVDVSGDIAVTRGAAALLLPMVTNLIQNAIVHNLPTGGRVWVNTSVEAGFARLVVSNTGEVLPRDALSMLTEPFQRGSGRIRDHDSGVGLGLAIVKSVVLAHAGMLTIEPRSTGGIDIRIDLPA